MSLKILVLAVMVCAVRCSLLGSLSDGPLKGVGSRLKKNMKIVQNPLQSVSGQTGDGSVVQQNSAIQQDVDRALDKTHDLDPDETLQKAAAPLNIDLTGDSLQVGGPDKKKKKKNKKAKKRTTTTTEAPEEEEEKEEEEEAEAQEADEDES